MPKKLTKAENDALRERIFAADGWRCADPICPCRNEPVLGGPLDPHHIQKRSECGIHTPSNRISLCRYIAHAKAENGYRDKETGKWVSGRQYMIALLKSLKGTRQFRWARVLAWLENCEARHRVGDKNK